MDGNEGQASAWAVSGWHRMALPPQHQIHPTSSIYASGPLCEPPHMGLVGGEGFDAAIWKFQATRNKLVACLLHFHDVKENTGFIFFDPQ